MLGHDKLTKLADTAFSTMEEENLPDSFVGVAMLVVETRTAEGETAFYTFCTDKRQWIQRACVEEARMGIEFAEVEADEVEADD